jgi:hypothetical protein
MKIEHGTWHILKIISVLSRLMDTLHNVSYYAQKKAPEIFDNYLDYVWNHLDHDCTWAVLWFPYANYKSANFFSATSCIIFAVGPVVFGIFRVGRSAVDGGGNVLVTMVDRMMEITSKSGFAAVT